MAVILAADIGGTNCRLGVFNLADGKLSMAKVAWLETGSISGPENLLTAFERELGAAHADADVISVALAGPVEDNCRGRLSNGVLELDFASLNRDGKKFFLINDFLGQAYAAVSPEGENSPQVYGDKPGPLYGVRAVMGAGTGLGQAILAPMDGSRKARSSRWLGVASENGHAAFPFVNGQENDFHTFLRVKRKIPYATGDETVTGRGLEALHEFLTGESLSAPQVGAQALSGDTPTLQWYSRLYARACRNWILATMCEGGLWIAGGIAAQNPYVVRNRHFGEELYNSPPGAWSDFLRSVPIFLMEDANSGLWGAARFGQQEVESRRLAERQEIRERLR